MATHRLTKDLLCVASAIGLRDIFQLFLCQRFIWQCSLQRLCLHHFDYFTSTLLSMHKLLLLLHLRFFHHSKPGELIAMVLQVAIAVLCRHYFHLVSPLDCTKDTLVVSGITTRIDSPTKFHHRIADANSLRISIMRSHQLDSILAIDS